MGKWLWVGREIIRYDTEKVFNKKRAYWVYHFSSKEHGSPVVRTPHFQSRGPASIPGCAAWSWKIHVYTLRYQFTLSTIGCLKIIWCVQFNSVAQSCLTLQPHEPQHARPPCPSPTPRVHPNPCPLSQWCHAAISSSVIPFSHLQSSPASGSFQTSQFFASGGQSIGVSALAWVFPMNTQDWSPLG